LEEGGFEAVLHYRDPIQALASLFSSPKNGEGFCLTPQMKTTSNGERMYTTPDTGEWWEAMQVLLMSIQPSWILFFSCHHQHVLLDSMWQRRGYKLVSKMNKFKSNIMLVSKCQFQIFFK
jgi:hypothetical protein